MLFLGLGLPSVRMRRDRGWGSSMVGRGLGLIWGLIGWLLLWWGSLGVGGLGNGRLPSCWRTRRGLSRGISAMLLLLLGWRLVRIVLLLMLLLLVHVRRSR